MANLEGKTVLVTAAAQGIGRASALAAGGAKVHAREIVELGIELRFAASDLHGDN